MQDALNLDYEISNYTTHPNTSLPLDHLELGDHLHQGKTPS